MLPRPDFRRYTKIPNSFAKYWVERATLQDHINGTKPDIEIRAKYKVKKLPRGVVLLEFDRTMFYNGWVGISFKATPTGIFSPFRG